MKGYLYLKIKSYFRDITPLTKYQGGTHDERSFGIMYGSVLCSDDTGTK
jgi:hypothetical protein